MTKPKKAPKPKEEEASPGKGFDEIMGALLRVRPMKPNRKKTKKSSPLAEDPPQQ